MSLRTDVQQALARLVRMQTVSKEIIKTNQEIRARMPTWPTPKVTRPPIKKPTLSIIQGGKATPQ
jgi:hypothetical protein